MSPDVEASLIIAARVLPKAPGYGCYIEPLLLSTFGLHLCSSWRPNTPIFSSNKVRTMHSAHVDRLIDVMDELAQSDDPAETFASYALPWRSEHIYGGSIRLDTELKDRPELQNADGSWNGKWRQ